MTLTFKIEYFTRWGERLCLVSNDKVYPMKWGAGNIWSVTIRNCPESLPEDYTYVLYSGDLISRTEWKHHHAVIPEGRKSATVTDFWQDCPIAGCPFPRQHSAAIFDNPGFRGAGTAIPVFSLRGSDDFGVGEFVDIPAFADWAARTGQNILQLLPINDTTRKGEWGDSYPYNPISSFALHPIYIHLQSVGVTPDEEFRARQKELNAETSVNYPKVMKLKLEYLHKAYAAAGPGDMRTRAFKAFCAKNASWLDAYAAFCARRDKEDENFYRWVQWHLDRQMSEAVEYCHSRGIYLKGDLPIGVGRDSVDADSFPKLFNLDSSTGAPPDYFSVDGQNWGFPTYNWDEMAKDDFAWWKRRLRKMAEYFDAFRIDHILGFFRIWDIPVEFSGGLYGHFNPALPYSRDEIVSMGLPIVGLFIEDPHKPGWFHPLISPDTSALEPWQKEKFDHLYTDFFYHRHDAFWRYNALRKLPHLLSATGMLACGEDLGMLPDCVPEVMDSQKILSLEMERMPKGHEWPYLSVCATSSHDMTSIRLWDSDDKEPSECTAILKRHLDSGSMLAIFPIQDWLSIDPALRAADPKAERINDPADSRNKWRWRLHLSTRQLMDAASWNTRVTTLIKDSGRG